MFVSVFVCENERAGLEVELHLFMIGIQASNDIYLLVSTFILLNINFYSSHVSAETNGY